MIRISMLLLAVTCSFACAAEPVTATAVVIAAGKQLPTGEESRGAAILLKSDAVLRLAAKEFKGGPEKDREDWIRQHMGVTLERDTNAIRINFRCEDGELAKAALTAIIQAFTSEMKRFHTDADEEKMALLKQAVQLNTTRLKENMTSRANTLQQMRKVAANPDGLQARFRKTQENIDTLRKDRRDLQRNISLIASAGKDDVKQAATLAALHITADSKLAGEIGKVWKQQIAAIDEDISEQQKELKQGSEQLTTVLPLQSQMDALNDYIKARTKLIDDYESQITQLELDRTQHRRVIVINAPSLAK